jgi:hypothetical protein
VTLAGLILTKELAYINSSVLSKKQESPAQPSPVNNKTPPRKMSAADISAGDDAIFRVSGRRIMFSAILIDAMMVAYTLVSAVFYFNIIRLPVYHPAMMQPWTNGWDSWQPYWRVFGPGALMFLPTFLYLLVFYRRAALMALYLVISILFIVFSLVCWVWLMVDWGRCDQLLWCPCITDYTVTGGMVTMTYCTPDVDNDGDHDASAVFIINFFTLATLIGLAIGSCVVSTWIHFQYYYRNDAYNNNNPYRTIAYVNHEMEEGVFHEGNTKPQQQRKSPDQPSNKYPSLYSVPDKTH